MQDGVEGIHQQGSLVKHRGPDDDSTGLLAEEQRAYLRSRSNSAWVKSCTTSHVSDSLHRVPSLHDLRVDACNVT